MTLLQALIGFFAFAFVLGLIILVHEGGHFFFAKRSGILCHEFSLGMGPVIWQKKKNETVYSIRAIPIGGFVSMAGEEVESDLLKGKKEIRIEVKNEKIVRIILDTDIKKYENLPLVSIVDYDLYGTKEARENELFIRFKDDNGSEDQLIVDRKAMVVFNRKQEFQIAPYDRNFMNKPLGARFASVIAGPVMNFILAILLFLIIGAIEGYPNFNATVIDDVYENTPVYEYIQPKDRIISLNGSENLQNWGDITTALSTLPIVYQPTIKVEVERSGVRESFDITPQIYLYSIGILSDYKAPDKVIVGNMVLNGFADKAGMKIGDEIKKITDANGTTITVTTWQEVMTYFNSHLTGSGAKIEVLRDSQTKEIDISETWNQGVLEAQGYKPVEAKIGITPEFKFNLGKTVTGAFTRTGDACMLIFNSLKLLFTNRQVGVDDLSGPIGIFQLTSQMALGGILSLLEWTAILSVNVGFLNILPLPALDGGRLAFLGYEAVTKKKPNAKVENTIHTIGFVLLMILFVFVAWNDILRLIGLK
jgi:regulator of sigma E protease